MIRTLTLPEATIEHQTRPVGSTNMPGIVCALQGGPQSQPTIRRAIELAQSGGLPLIFTYNEHAAA